MPSVSVKTGLTRRTALGGAVLLIPALIGPSRAALAAEPSWDALAALEKSSGARIGVAAIDTGNGRTVSYRDSERFIMCSSFKLSLAAAVLQRADAGQEKLDRVVRYQKNDLLDVSPETTRNLAGGMRVDALCRAAVVYSDNTAANLLLNSIGGPAGVTSFWRSLGDETSRLDRIEPALNLPDGDKDTTTPVATMGNLRAMLLGDALSPAARASLQKWMIANTTGGLVLRAGLPKSWTVGDKTGRYSQGAFNAAIDLAIATPPSSTGLARKPILIAAYSMNGRGDANAHQALVADIGKVIATALA